MVEEAVTLGRCPLDELLDKSSSDRLKYQLRPRKQRPSTARGWPYQIPAAFKTYLEKYETYQHSYWLCGRRFAMGERS